MATARIQEELEAIVMCAICLNNMAEKDARMLPACGHGFCLQCLKQLHVTQIKSAQERSRPPPSADQITCPTCRHTTTLPRGAVENLTKFHVIGKVAGVMSTLEKEDNYFVCGRCQKGNPPVMYCFDCIRLFCHICQPKHEEKKLNNHHVTTTVTRDILNSLLCQEHCEYVADFCIQCNVVTCESCHDSSHRDHDRRTFILKSSKSSIVNMKDEIVECEKTQTVLDDYRRKTYARLDNEKAEIDILVKKAVDHIMCQGKDLKHELNCSIGELDMTYDMLQYWKETAQECSTTHTPLANLPHLSLTGNEDIKVPCPLSALIDDIPEYTTRETLSKITDVRKFIIARIHTKTDKVHLNIHARKQMNDVRQKETTHRGQLSKNENNKKTDSSATSPVFGEQNACLVLNIKADVESLDFLPNGDIISVVGDQLVVHNQKGQLVHLPYKLCGLGYLISHVDDVAIHQETGNTAICSWDEGDFELTVFMSDDDPFISQNMRITGIRSDITYTPDGSVLLSKYPYGSDDNTQHIVKVADGCEVWTEELDHGCDHMAVYNNGRIITSHANDGLHIYTANMTKLHTIEDTVHLPSPCGVCTDSKDNLYVVDSSRGVVCLYSKEWKYVMDIITGLDNGPYKDIDMDIAIYKDTFLAVCHGQHDTRCISLFSILSS